MSSLCSPSCKVFTLPKLLLILGCLADHCSFCLAQWSTDPTQNTLLGYGLLPEICSDSAGGVYVAHETPISPPRHIEVRKLNRLGAQPWGSPIIVQGTASQSIRARLVSDGEGGAVICFVNYGGLGEEHIRVQRIDSVGNILWGETGTRASIEEHPQGDPEIVSDGQQGCIVAWFDILNVTRAQRIDSLGNRMWGDSGIYVFNGSSRPLIRADERGGFFVFRGATLIQRYNHDGISVWGPKGVQIANIGVQTFANDAYGGVVIAGMKMIDYNNGDPYWRGLAQRLDSTGQTMWTFEGVVVAESLQNTGLGSPPRVRITTELHGDAVFTFSDRVSSNTLQSMIQRVAPHGNLRFPGDGLRVSGLDTTVNKPSDIITSISASQIVILEDTRNNGSIFAQRIDSSGSRLLGSNDIAVSLRNLSYLSSVTDGNGGVIVVGFDQSDFSLRAQQFNHLGELGEVDPVSVNDQPFPFPLAPLLYPNYPNPFNPSTTISFSLAVNSTVTLKVYNLIGQEIATLSSGEMSAGTHRMEWSGKDAAGRSLSSGLYFYTLKSTPLSGGGSFSETRKMILMK